MMRQFYRHGDNVYIIHRAKTISSFTDKTGHVRLDIVKEYRDYFDNVDHVLKTDSHFLFVETVQDAEIIEETQNMVENPHN